jgi:hypothetical protein
MKDAFDQWWEWANMPFSDMAIIPAEIHQAVMACRPRIVTTATRSTKPCGGIKATGVQIKRGQVFPNRSMMKLVCTIHALICVNFLPPPSG